MAKKQLELQVGNIGETGWHFIGVSPHLSEVAKNASGKRLRVVKFERQDIPWLIAALSKELEMRPLSEEAAD
jgi:hypothetical protein